MLDGYERPSHVFAIPDAGRVAGPRIGLPAIGGRLLMIHGRFYLPKIAWPMGGMRTVGVWLPCLPHVVRFGDVPVALARRCEKRGIDE